MAGALTMAITPEREAEIRAFADELIGTSQGLPEAYVDWPAEDLEFLYTLVFCCEGCGWWCSVDEWNDGDVGIMCDECVGE